MRKTITKKYLKKLEFEHADYKARYFKLVGRVKIQLEQINALQDLVTKLNSQIANDGLALLLAKQRAADLENWVALKRPDVERLGKAVARQKAAASAGVQKPINVTLVQRRRLNKVPSTI